MLELIKTMKHVKAWYSPTAFWPSFNQISAPSLMCVPDVVLKDFPCGFSTVGGNRFLETFRKVEKAIRGGSHFVTYSNHVRQNTLVKNYGINEEAIHVVHHAPNNLSELIHITDSEECEIVSRAYCESLLEGALRKASFYEYASGFSNTSVKFIFYASQFRPSKNILTLLRAYQHLLKNRYIGYKLFLTGSPNDLPEVSDFINSNNLGKDVLLLPGLTVSELAACYKLAELAVNPSLSEGGFPFTFTEALSVGTPVIMAKIPVTTEIITDRLLQNNMLFDPYNWQSLSTRIEWALANKEQLLTMQMELYRTLSQRNWRNVVDEYISILDKLAGEETSFVEKIPLKNKEFFAEPLSKKLLDVV